MGSEKGVDKQLISLCMIVRNEEKNLPRCLESARSQVDEIVVVDTGSEDRSKEIAARYGAKILTFSWTGDFSEARNFALEHASGNWILWLDADEELLPSPLGVDLRDVVNADAADAFLVPIQNMKIDGKFDSHYAIRLFKKLQGIRFEGRVHEGVGEWLLRKGARIDRSPVAIRHWGYAISEEEMNKKIQRNLELLRAQLKEDPRNSYLHYYLGMTLIGVKEYEKSYYHLQEAYRLKPPTPNMECLILNMLCYHQLHRQDYQEAERLARESLAIIPIQHTAKLFLGIALFNQARYREALPLLQEAYQFQRLPLERRRSDISLEHSYGEPELVWAVARSAYEIGNYSLAYQFFRRLEGLRGKNARDLAYRGICAMRLGSYAEAVRLLYESRNLGSSWKDVASPLVYALLQLGELSKATEIFETSAVDFFENRGAAPVFALMVERYFELGNITELIDLLERVRKKVLQPVQILDALSICYIKKKAYPKAKKVLEQLLQLVPGNEEIMKRMAALCAKEGNLLAAKKILSDSCSRAAVSFGDPNVECPL